MKIEFALPLRRIQWGIHWKGTSSIRTKWKEELEGWDHITLLKLDLTGREDPRPIYAVEQQLQHKTEWQDLGYQRLNRVAGAGPWGNKPRGTVMVGFAYAPRGWLEAHYHEIAIVRVKKRGGAPDGTNVDLTGLAGSKLRTTGMLPTMGKKTSL